MNLASKNFSYVTIGQIASVGLQASFYFIFATFLDTSIYGQMSFLIALAGTVSFFSRLGLHQTVTISQAKENKILSNQINVLLVILSSISALILLFYNEFAAVLAFSLSLFVMNQHNLLGLKKYKKNMLLTILRSSLFVILPIIFYSQIGIPGILLGMAIGNFSGSFGFLKTLNFKIQSFNEIKKNYQFVFHNFGLDASLTLPRLIDKLFIMPLFGFVIVGIYQFNMQILFALEIFPLALYSFLLSEESSGKSHRKITSLILLLSGLLAFLVIIFSPYVVDQLFPLFSDGIFSLQILVISIIPISISYILSAKLQSRESTKVGYSVIIRMSSLFVLIAILGELYGLMGLSIAVLLSAIFNTIFLAIIYNRLK